MQDATMPPAEPWSVLGLDGPVPLAEAEAAYRSLIWRAHPDRVAAEGEGAVTEAAERTRALNHAIATIRRAAYGLAPSEDPDRPGGAARCPWCQRVFEHTDAFVVHVSEVHRWQPPPAHPYRRSVTARATRWVASLPAWFMVPLLALAGTLIAMALASVESGELAWVLSPDRATGPYRWRYAIVPVALVGGWFLLHVALRREAHRGHDHLRWRPPWW